MKDEVRRRSGKPVLLARSLVDEPDAQAAVQESELTEPRREDIVTVLAVLEDLEDLVQAGQLEELGDLRAETEEAHLDAALPAAAIGARCAT